MAQTVSLENRAAAERIRLLSYPTEAGGPEPRPAHGPWVLNRHGLSRASSAAGIDAPWPADPPPQAPAHRGQRAVEVIAHACGRLVQSVATCLTEGAQLAFIGGRHTSAVDTWGASRAGPTRRVGLDLGRRPHGLPHA